MLKRSLWPSWLILSLPALWLLAGLAGDPEPWLPDYVAESGAWSARLIVLALCLSPLQRLIGNPRWLAFLVRRRRAMGVAAFCYTLLHLLFYLADMGAVAAILDEMLLPSMASGWSAFVLLVPLALTSNNRSMRALGRGWKRLQRLAYPAAILTLLHWLWVHDGAVEAWLTFAPLIILQSLRLLTLFPTERKFA